MSSHDGYSQLTQQCFQHALPRIAATFDAFLETEYGRQLVGPGKHASLQTYGELTHWQPLSADLLGDTGFEGLLLATTDLEEFTTTGTRGTPRSVYWPTGTSADVSSLLRRVQTASRIISTYSSAVLESDVFLKAHVDGMRNAAQSVRIASFATRTDVAEIVSNADAIVLTDYPSALARFVRLTAGAIRDGQLSPSEVRGTKVVARLTGEPMYAEDLAQWLHGASSLGFEIEIELRYGCTEFLGIGKSDFEPNDSEIVYRLTDLECFVEVLDAATLGPVHTGRGLVCGTSFRTSGTILFRYLLGDEAEIFERDGERLVRNIRRRDALIVTGNTVSMSDLVAAARLSLGLEVCVDVRKTVDNLSGVQHVSVMVYVPSDQLSDLETARVDIENRLLDQLRIRSAVDVGFVALNVQSARLGSVVERRRKAWRLHA